MFSDDVRSEVQCADSSETANQRDSSAHLVVRQIVAHTSEDAAEAELCVAASSPEIAGGLERVNIAPATDSKARRGPCMSRRTGQRGTVFQKGTSTWSQVVPAYGKFWIDTPEGRKRKTISLGVCHTRVVSKQQLREYIEASGTNSVETFIAATAPALTFRKQAEIYMDSLAKRRRKPIKPATLSVWGATSTSGFCRFSVICGFQKSEMVR